MKVPPAPRVPPRAAPKGLSPPSPWQGHGRTAFSALLEGPVTGRETPPRTTSLVPEAPRVREEAPRAKARDLEHEPDEKKELDLLEDTRHAAQLAPPAFLAQAASCVEAPAPVQARAQASLEELVPALVRRIAWAGDARKGSVRIELGAGELAGAVLVVHADDGKVKVELAVPGGVDGGAWRERLERRLAARGLDAKVEVS